MSDTIFIIEDDLKIAHVVKAYLEGAGFKARHFTRGRAALEAASREHPALVILDLMLPDLSGEELFQDLKALSDIPVIMVTSRSSEEERVAGLALGADDYVVKPFSPRELIFRVKAVLKRVEGSRPGGRKDVLSFEDGRLVLDGQTYQVTRDGVVADLTASEFKILFILASRPGRVYSRDELIQQALDYHFEGYDRTIDAHVRNIRKKIEPDPGKPRFVQTVYGIGYRFGGRQDA
ncbi:MAG: response regulator transcription factor [bacterium]|nr:response regulator transcription factor [bacterium]MDT8396865.1 response regulator transcription factor [bacterium]